jgi:alpha-L-fucosidase 2
VTIVSSADSPQVLQRGQQRVDEALRNGYDSLLQQHTAWWKAFWDRSGVRVPDPAIQQQYDLVQYCYGAASRPGAPPIPLQGVWTADEGTLPPWHGDYHHDLNTQLTYWAYLASGRFDEGRVFVDFMWRLLPAHRKFARDFYAAPGAALPRVMALDGKPMGGGGQYSLSPTMGAWVAQAFYWHWLYTGDERFLAERAYPYCAEIGRCLQTLLKPGADGKLKLALSTSPEIHDNSLKAWLAPNSNFDLSLLRWLFGALAEMATSLDKSDEAAQWRKTLDRLDPLAIDEKTLVLKLAPDEMLTVSHRHFSHLMPIHPLGTLTVEGGDAQRRIVEASIDHLERLGTSAWCGYSFSWMAAMAARAAQPDRAARYLEIFVKAFVSRNGFHLNGDYQRLGYSSFAYRPFTLEGNFAAGQAVHEMLLQSWGGRLRVFPAVPEKWRSVAFDDLRAEGAWRVSARREGARTTWVRIVATRAGQVRLRDPFAGQTPRWNRPDVTKDGSDFLCRLGAGEALEALASPGGARRAGPPLKP